MTTFDTPLVSEVGPLLVNAKTAAMLLCVSERTLWTLTNCGDVPCVRIGRTVRYDRRDLLKWIETKKSNRR